MRRKRRGIREDGEHDMELADVNEQELAKSAEECADVSHINEENKTQDLVAEEKNSETDNAQFVTVEQSGGEIVARSEDPLDVVMAEQDSADDTQGDAEADGEYSDVPPLHTADDGEDGTEEYIGAQRVGRIYVAVIAACMVIALCVFGLTVFYSTVDYRDADMQESGGEVTDTDIGNADASPAPNGGALSLLSQSAVSVVAERDGKLCYSSGTAVLEDGYVAALYSAVKDASSIKIVLDNGSAYPAELVAYDESVELALLSTDALQLRFIDAVSSEYNVGETVYAVGNAHDGELVSSLFAGRVSYISRGYEFDVGNEHRIANTVQISGFDNASMLGCPIFNENGEAIAIVFAALEGKDTCFALPIEGVLNVLKVMRDGGKPDRDALQVLAYSPASVSVFGKQSCIDGIWGVEIMEFEDGEGDSAVKLRRGDLIYRINDTFVAGTDSLKAELSLLREGDEAKIYVLRNGQRLSFDVVLG